MAKEHEEVKEAEEKELSDEFVDKKDKKKEKKKPSIISKIINLVITVAIFAWVAVALIDFYNVHQEKDPQFCLEKQTVEYTDGTVEVCKGLGYKVYYYNRTSFQGYEFGPFWITDRSNEQ